MLYFRNIYIYIFQLTKQKMRPPLADKFRYISSNNQKDSSAIQNKNHSFNVRPVSNRSSKNKTQEQKSITIDKKSIQEVRSLTESSEERIIKLIKKLIEKGRKISQFLQKNQLTSSEQFLHKHFYKSQTIKIHLENLIEKMMHKGRIGSDLKGINKDILQEIDNSVIPLVQKEYTIYKCGKEFHQQRNHTIKYLNDYRSELQKQLSQLSNQNPILV